MARMPAPPPVEPARERLIAAMTDALRRRPGVASPEELFDEIYRGQAAAKTRS